MANKIDYCPKCGSYLNYDADSKEYFCSNILPDGAPMLHSSCDYSEFEKWEFTKKFRLELD